MTKVYFAGPNVFYSDYEQYKLKIKTLCIQSGIEPLFPNEKNLNEPYKMCLGNISLIKQADAVVANLTPSRGPIEPDSGTTFECGLAFGMAKNIIGYIEGLPQKTYKLEKMAGAHTSTVDHSGVPVHLMLAYCVDLTSSLEEAILHVCQTQSLPTA